MGIRERIGQRAPLSAATQAWVSLVVAADHLRQQTDAVCERRGLTGDQYNVLRILRGAGREGHPRGEITRRLLRRAPDTTRMLDRLEERGWVVRSRDPADARVSRARITAAGVRLLAALDPEIAAVMDSAMAPLPTVELAQLTRLCEALVP
jgi:DNA-binding MarR family transcriptional regulator